MGKYFKPKAVDFRGHMIEAPATLRCRYVIFKTHTSQLSVNNRYGHKLVLSLTQTEIKD